MLNLKVENERHSIHYILLATVHKRNYFFNYQISNINFAGALERGVGAWAHGNIYMMCCFILDILYIVMLICMPSGRVSHHKS